MLIVTGTLAYDYIMNFPGKFGEHILPEQIHKLNISFNLENFEKRRGGTAGNVSYTLGLLKSPHILFSVAGRGFEEYQEKFTELGINLDHVVLDSSKKISTGFAMTDLDNNQIWGFYYGAAENLINLHISSVATNNDLILAGPSGAQATMHVVDECIEQHIPYMFDPGMILSKLSDEELTRGVQHATYLVGNDYELTLIKQRIPDWNKHLANKVIITTLGEKGSIIEHEGKTYTIQPAKNVGIVDPTGAGDAWRAGFFAGLEKNYDLQICGQLGSVAASYAVEVYGTQEHTFTKEEFKERYKETFGEEIEL